MRPYYEDDLVTIYHGDCRDIVNLPDGGVVVTDPPFNVGYHYDSYDDNLPEPEYRELLAQACGAPSVVIHYPEDIFKVAEAIGAQPEKCAAWVYNANTPRQWRMAAWFGVTPDFTKGEQPYKNPTDKRIAKRISEGKTARLYDWWNVQQVKNVSEVKTGHPAQMPLSIMRNIISVTPANVIVDPFMGSGTTLRAAKDLGRKAIGVELSEAYCEAAARRLGQESLLLGVTA